MMKRTLHLFTLLKFPVPVQDRASIKTTARFYFTFLIGFMLFATAASAQLGIYEFTGSGSCPNQDPAVTTQPVNAAFSTFSTVSANCVAATDVNLTDGWNENPTINTGQYYEFSINADAGFAVNLTSISFTQLVSEKGSGSGGGNTRWILRSSLDGFTANIATSLAGETVATETVPLSGFINLPTVTFRLYITEIKDNSTTWSIDNVSAAGSVTTFTTIPPDPANPTSNSPRCETPGVTITATGSAPTGVTWYWQTSATGTSTAVTGPTYIVTTSGTYYLRAQNNSTLEWSNGAGSVTVVVNPNVQTPVFALGATSLRCLGGGSQAFTATATGATSITYSIDGLSALAGNSINATTGVVTFSAIWVGSTTITATAAGCNGPRAATHIVTISTAVSTPNFLIGATSSRCQGAGTVTYSAVAANTSGLTYSLDASSLAGGNTISASTGEVTYVAGWAGTTTITASAAGCAGPKTATHTVTVNPPVGTPVFSLGATSSRCQAATLVVYTATASSSTGLSYALDATSLAAGNTINVSTGQVAYVAGWSGTSTITATANGCAGPRSATHTVTTSPLVTTPVFALGATSSRCQAAGTQTYTATATNATGISYALDAVSLAGGNTINTTTGAVTFTAAWTGAAAITVTVTGCSGPRTATHTVTTSASVTTPVFILGSSSSRMQGAGNVTYTASAFYTTGITYTLDAASLAGGNTINATTGQITYSAGWNGTSVITASAAGCGGPRTQIHTVLTNNGTVIKQLYFSEGATLDRMDPVNTADATTANTTLA